MASVGLVRWLVFVLVLGVCLSQLMAEAFKFPGSREKTKEEREEEERLKAAKIAYKQVFVRSGKLTRDEIFEKLQALDHYYGSEDHRMPIDFRLLMKYNQTDEANCDDRQYVDGLKRLTKQTRKEFKALHDYVEDCFQRQLEVCDYENRFKRVVAMFQRDEAEKWQLIEEFNGAVAQYGKRMYDWKGKNIDNTWQMNEALEQMFEWKVEHNHWPEQVISYKSYNLARDIIEACKLFDERVGTSLLMTTINPKVKQNEEILEWLRYLNICGQVERVNFERAIGKMFNKYHLPGLNEWWDGYLGYREHWV